MPPRWSKIGRAGPHAGGQVAVEQDERQLARPQQIDDGRRVLLGQGQQEPVDLALLEQAHVVRVEPRVALGVRQEQRVPRRPQPTLGAGDDLGEDRVGDVGDGEADREGPAPAESLGEDVRAVAEVVDGREDDLAHAGADVGVLGEDARDRRDGDARAVGHLADARLRGRPGVGAAVRAAVVRRLRRRSSPG
jgi:hypothetical protein